MIHLTMMARNNYLAEMEMLGSVVGLSRGLAVVIDLEIKTFFI